VICVHFRSARGIPITSISWAPMLCATPGGGAHPDFITAIIIVDVSSLACQDTLPLLTPSAHLHMWCFAGGRWAARVCIVAALLWHRGGGSTVQPKRSIPRFLLPSYLPPSPTRKLNPPIYHIFFLLDPQTQISYRRPATRHSAGMTFLGSFQQYGGFRPWWRGLV
jgi:hypothetical protein